MALPRLRPVPGFLLALTVLAELAAVPLSWGLEPAWDTLLLAVSSTVTTAAGALILSRHPRHAIGWLLIAQGLLAALAGDLAQGWGLRAAAQGWPLGPPAEFVASASWLPTAPLGVAVLLLFPTGHLLARPWSLVLVLSVIGTVLAEPGWVLNPNAGEVYVAGRNPYAVDWLPTQELFVGGFAIGGGVAARCSRRGRDPVPHLERGRAAAAEVVRSRQRRPRHRAAAREARCGGSRRSRTSSRRWWSPSGRSPSVSRSCATGSTTSTWSSAGPSPTPR